MRFVSGIILIALAVTLFGCDQGQKKPQVLNNKITKQNLPDLADKIKENKDLSFEQIDLLAQGITRLVIDQDTLEGKTLDYVLESQKEYVRKNKLQGLDDNFSKVALIINHNFKYLGIKPQTQEDKDWDMIIYQIENLSDKPITNVSGNLQFFNMNNQLIKSYPLQTALGLKDDEAIKPGDIRRVALPYIHNSQSVRDSIMRFGNKSLKSAWYPEKITFKDGTEIKIDRLEEEEEK